MLTSSVLRVVAVVPSPATSSSFRTLPSTSRTSTASAAVVEAAARRLRLRRPTAANVRTGARLKASANTFVLPGL
ncbi:hypothetical protein PC120_g10159 [Phytophthora cactorum]|nr:hypothetical protein PC120_g10159 [Phytophthora cactorum]